MHRPELLAPAGDEASLAAALAAGADAVYFGLDEGLNARARATNFSAATLQDTVDRVHRAGARALLTLNTLVFEAELAWLEGLLRVAATAGVDAVIVQDPAVALLARAVAPTMAVHASTQMTVSSPEAARFAADLGCVRIVAPRELSLPEIARLVAGTPLEVEVFVHGALCVSWSGQCLTSEAWGGRSANRGQCAQSCRLPYTLVVDGRALDTGDVRYLLSPLDQAAFRALPRLVELGVASLKIEGRLKGPTYVATAVGAYARWLDAIAAGEAASPAAQARVRSDVTRLGVAYSRGFGDGFFAGSDHQDLVEGRFPKHRGVLLGVVTEVQRGAVRVDPATRAATGALAVGGSPPAGPVAAPLPPVGGAAAEDARGVPGAPITPFPGLGVGFDTGQPEAEEPGGPIWAVSEAGEGWWLQFSRDNHAIARVAPGDRVWVTHDPRLDAEVERLVGAGEPEGRLGVQVTVSGTAGSPCRVRMVCGGVAVEGDFGTLAPAVGRGLDAAHLADKLGAFGGTPFRLGELQVGDLGAGLHLSPSVLKAARRELVPRLLAAVLGASRHPVAPGPVAAQVVDAARARAARRSWTPPAAPELVVLCRNDAQLDAALAAGLPYVELDWMELSGLGRAVARARAAGAAVGIATVRVHKPGEEAYDRRIAALSPDAVLVRHWAGLVHFASLPDAERPVIHGDFSLNVTNSVTAHHLLAVGADTWTAAHDLDATQLHAVLRNVDPGRVTVVVHHHVAAFHTEHCVYAHTMSSGRDFRTCGRPCEAHRLALRDPTGLDHPVVVDVGCRNTVFEARAGSAARAVGRLREAGVRRFRVELVWESGDEAAAVIAAYRDLLAGRATAAEVLRRVAAHEQFGVTAGTMRTFGTAAP